MAADAPALATRDLTKYYGRGQRNRGVDGLDLEVHTGEVFGFLGPNGAGKTTTMRMIMGVLAIHGGEVRVDGRPITAADRRTFGYMPEERGLYPKQRIVDQLVYLGRLRGLSAARAKASVTDHLDRLGLADRAKEKVQKLSLGNQQRVQIIAALMGTNVTPISILRHRCRQSCRVFTSPVGIRVAEQFNGG